MLYLASAVLNISLAFVGTPNFDIQVAKGAGVVQFMQKPKSYSLKQVILVIMHAAGIKWWPCSPYHRS